MKVEPQSTQSPPCSLEDLGWRPFFEEQRVELGEGIVPARVIVGQREHFHVLGEFGNARARILGKMRHEARDALDLPAVGDWVGVSLREGAEPRLVHLFRRRTRFVRQAAGRKTEVQVVAANVDVVAVVTSPNNDFNPRRLERYIAAIRESGADALFVLNKADLRESVEDVLGAFRDVAAEVPVVVTSAKRGEGLDSLHDCVKRGDTLVFVGSSGVGKSTLVNHLLGNVVQRTGEIRERDERGKHVTSHRELFLLPDGGLLMDTPGMRELQVWAFDEAELRVFDDMESLATTCRFRDCTHHDEPGCAVRGAVAQGTLTAERLASYHKLHLELELQQQRRAQVEANNAKSRWKSRSRAIRRFRKG